ncbi:MAG: permease-like cell division protein FtsX [Proteobacteria bacterium]|nr:permease-like cell division protein FtsX [Pseudomonadota bacterium]
MDEKFNVPQEKVEISDTFLMEYWQEEQSLSKVGQLELLVYFLKQGFRTIKELPTSNTVSIVTFAVSLFLLSGFLLILQNVGKSIAQAGNSFYLTAYIKDGISSEEITTIISNLKKDKRVQTIEYISKDKAFQNFKVDLGSNSFLLDGLAEQNPLPASLDITLNKSAVGHQTMETFIDKIRAYKSVIEDVAYGNEWVEKIQNVLKIFRLIGAGILIVVILVVVSLISNTIKLVFFARRDEISIMRLVGAPQIFIFAPFVVGGILQGVIGSILGLLTLWFFYQLLLLNFSSISYLNEYVGTLSFLPAVSILIIFCIGIIVGGLASYLSINKYINV